MSKYRADVPAKIANPARVIADPATRAYIYRLSIPVLALLVGIGVVAEGTSGLILNVVAGVLAVGTSALAAVNTGKPTP